MEFVTIDFEASCLPTHGRSFPIEVGISGSEGAQSWLIRPNNPRDWDWTEEARGLHGLTPEQLDAEGCAPEIVFVQLRQALAGRRAVADSRIDIFWWNRLAGLALVPGSCPIDPVDQIFDAMGATTEEILRAQSYADMQFPPRHRAAHDALWLRGVLLRLEKLVSDRLSHIGLKPVDVSMFPACWIPRPPRQPLVHAP